MTGPATDSGVPGTAGDQLRSNLPVGSPRWATRRAQWLALGLTEADLTKPKIAVVNSSSGLAPCFSHLDPIAAAVRESVAAAGGVAFEVRTVAPSDFIMSAGSRGGYVLSSRDLLAADIEAVVEGAQLDGMVCLASCDKTTPGQLMAAARLDVPTLIVPCGYQSCGRLDDGERVDIEEVFLRAGHLASGGITLDGLCDLGSRAITGPGVCTGMGTANSMHIAAEALGMTLPGSAPVRANSEPMWRAVRHSGDAIVSAVRAGRRPRGILTEAAFHNAVASMLAVSASINTVKHLQAVAREADTDVDVYRLFETLAGTVRPLAAVRPNGADTIEEFEDAGGALAVLRQLGDVVAGEAATVTGETMAHRVAGAVVADERIIRPLSDPRADHPTIVVIRGSLAPTPPLSSCPSPRRASRPSRASPGCSRTPPRPSPRSRAGWCSRATCSCCGGSDRSAPPGWAWPRRPCSRCTVRASPGRSRWSPTDNCPVWSTRASWSARCRRRAPCPARSGWSPTATRSPWTCPPGGWTCSSTTPSWTGACGNAPRTTSRARPPGGWRSTRGPSNRSPAARRCAATTSAPPPPDPGATSEEDECRTRSPS
jgi:hypothetical protein